MTPRAVLAVLILAACAVAQDKPAAPSPVEQTEVEKMIKDVFKDDYLKRAPADRQALGKRLLSQGIQSKDDLKYRFVLLREARDIAAQSGDTATALEAVDELSKSFTVEAGPMKLAVIAQAAKAAKTVDDFKGLVRLSLKMIDGFLAVDDYDSADKGTAAALQYAKKAQDVVLVNRVAGKSKEIGELKARFEKLKKARETLAADPSDGASNHLLGHFLCVVKGDWDRGLPMLSKGPDPVYGPLALKELAAPQDAAAQLALGDGWWDLGEKESGPSKERLKEHASVWYERASGKLSGINKTKVDRRLLEGRVARLQRGSWLDVTEPKLFNVPGKPGDPVEITAKAGSYLNLKLQFPKGDFDGVTVRMLLDPAKGATAFIIYEGPVGFATCLDTDRAFFANMRGVGNGWNLDFTENWTKEAEAVVTVLLVEGEYVVYLNGAEKARVKTRLTKLESLALEARNGTVKFDQIRLRRME